MFLYQFNILFQRKWKWKHEMKQVFFSPTLSHSSLCVRPSGTVWDLESISPPMAYSSLVLYYLSQRRVPGRSFRHFFFIPTSLALVTSLLILFYISTTSNLFAHHHPNSKTPLQINSSSSSSSAFSFTILHHKTSSTPFAIEAPLTEDGGGQRIESQRSLGPQLGSDGMSILNLCFWDLANYANCFDMFDGLSLYSYADFTFGQNQENFHFLIWQLAL